MKKPALISLKQRVNRAVQFYKGEDQKKFLLDMAFKKIMSLHRNEKNKIGNYAEFGLWEGRSFIYARDLNLKFGANMHMYGYDSLQDCQMLKI